MKILRTGERMSETVADYGEDESRKERMDKTDTAYEDESRKGRMNK